MNLPGVPAFGVTYLRAAVQTAMADTVRIVRPDIPVYDSTTGYATGVTKAGPGYFGKAHVHTAGQSAPITVGDTTEPMAVIEISVPFDAQPVPRNEDHVVIQAMGPLGDQTLVGETLRIINISNGGLGFAVRQLTCTYEQANPFDEDA